MNTDFFSPISVPRGQFTMNGYYVSEIEKPGPLRRQSNFFDERSVELLDEIAEITTELTIEHLFSGPTDEELKKLFTKMAVKEDVADVLGVYFPKGRNIEFYSPPAVYRDIVQIHERFHAIQHLIPDEGGNIWYHFPDVSSAIKELLAQLFTFRYCSDKRPDLMTDFLDLNEKQDARYQVWRIFRHWDAGKVEALYWEIRQKVNLSQELGFLDTVLKGETNIRLDIKNTIETIIAQIPVGLVFDSHFVINMMLKDYSDMYLQFASKFSKSSILTVSVHGQIGRLINQFDGSLVKRLENQSFSYNIHGEPSACTCWKRIQARQGSLFNISP